MTPVLDAMLFDQASMCAGLGAALAAAIVATLALVVARATRGRPAPLRYGLLLAALVVLGLVPVVAAASRFGGWGAVRASMVIVDRPFSPRPFVVTAAVPRPAPVPAIALGAKALPPDRLTEPAVVPMRVPTVRESASCLLWAWIGGFVGCVGLVVRDLIRLRRLRRSLVPCPSPAAITLLSEAARSVGLRRPPRLCESAAVPVPVVIGPARPTVVLPAGLATALDPEKLSAVLVHEAAHVIHGDLWVGLLQHAVAAVFWWCPPVHRLNRRLAEVREEICDDYVVSAQGDGFQLAEVLVEMAAGLRAKRQRLAIGTLGAIDEKPALEGRVERLVDLKRRALPMTRMNRTAMAATGAFGMAALAIVVATTIHAADERPVARPKGIPPDKGLVAPATTATTSETGAVALFRFRKADSQTDAGYQRSCQTHVVLVKGSEVLTSALQHSGVAELTCLRGEQDPIGWLMRHVDVCMQPGSEILSISVRGVDAAEARAIVTAVSQAYLANVVDVEKQTILKQRDALERKYMESMAGVRAKLDTYHQLVQSLGIADSEEASTQRSLLLDRLRSLGERISRLEADKLAVETDLGVAAELGEPPDPKLAARHRVLDGQIMKLADESNRVADKVKALETASADLRARKQEIDHDMKFTDQIGVQLNATEIAATLSQVELLGVETLGAAGPGSAASRVRNEP
jgi:beta-lactamase regulating signal transducer with metallopeptidase domain